MVSISGDSFDRFERAARARGLANVGALVDLAFKDGIPADIEVPFSTETPPTSASTIGTWRVEQGITRAALGKLIGCGVRPVRNWERGVRPSPKHARKLRALGCEVRRGGGA